MAYGFQASAAIYPARLVSGVASEPFYVDQSTASTRHLGVSQKGTYYGPGSDADLGYAAPAGKSIKVHQEGEEAFLKLGGTVSAFDLLTADASGQGVTITDSTAKQYVGAIAMQDGASGNFIRVKVKCFEYATN